MNEKRSNFVFNLYNGMKLQLETKCKYFIHYSVDYQFFFVLKVKSIRKNTTALILFILFVHFVLHMNKTAMLGRVV